MEIERKFLLKSEPKLPIESRGKSFQSYLSVDPEIRIRQKIDDVEGIICTFTSKTDGDLERGEFEFKISINTYDELFEHIDRAPILKDYVNYILPKGLVLETSLVDKGVDHSFAYAEVEFPDVETALAWEPLDCLGEEITYDANYKMKNYWRRTR